MNGGKLVQHQSQSGFIHSIETHHYGTINVSSTHHQAQYPFNMGAWNYKIIGWSTNESKFHLNGDGKEMNPPQECEIVYYPDTKSLGIQSHPEYDYYQKNYPEDLKVIQKIFTDYILNKL